MHHIANRPLRTVSVCQEAIDNAIAALGAALRSYGVEDGRVQRPNKEAVTRHHLATLMLSQLTNKPGAKATALTCCLIFIALESLFGNREKALKYLGSGFDLIERMVPIEDLLALTDPRKTLCQIVLRAKNVAQASGSDVGRFVLDMGILVPIQFVAANSSDGDTRKRAEEIMEAAVRQLLVRQLSPATDGY